MINDIIEHIDLEDLDEFSFSNKFSDNSYFKKDKNYFEDKIQQEEEEKNVDDLVNYLMENSSKRTILFETEPLPMQEIQKIKKGAKTVPKVSKANFKKEMREGKSKTKHVENKSQLNITEASNDKRVPLSLPFNSDNNQVEDFPDQLEEEFPDRMIIEDYINTEPTEEAEIPKEKPKAGAKEKDKTVKQSPQLTKNVKKKLDQLAKKAKGIEEEGESISDAESDDSKYLIFGKDYDMLIECYNEENDFIDINEVVRKTQEFKVVGGNSNLYPLLDRIILPKKAETHIGKEYQANLPPLLDKTKTPLEKRALCKIWDPARISREDYESYLTILSQLTKVPKSNMSEEKAVEALLDNNYNIEYALKFCHSNCGYVKAKINTKQKKLI